VNHSTTRGNTRKSTTVRSINFTQEQVGDPLLASTTTESKTSRPKFMVLTSAYEKIVRDGESIGEVVSPMIQFSPTPTAEASE
jgi:hypothetical protein